MTPVLAEPFVTPIPWPRAQAQYGTDETYRLAADWVRDCSTVADWGGANGYLACFLPETVQYTVVDGTQQHPGGVLADLCRYDAPSEGIVLRHVLDNTPEWRPILRNAIRACRQRLVIVTFTPESWQTVRIQKKNGWPIWHFHPADLIRELGDLFVRDDRVPTSHPEHVYYASRR